MSKQILTGDKPGNSTGLKLEDVRLRAAIIVVVFACALYGFSQGAGTLNNEDISADGWLAWIYYTVNLFVLGGIELGVPLPGGAPGAHQALWLAYYLAPIVTTTVIANSIRKLLEDHRISHFVPDNHVLVIGVGELANLYIQAIRKVDPLRLIVQVDKNATAEPDMHGSALTKRIPGDINDREFLSSLGLNRAFRAVVISTDDLSNLETGWEINSLNPALPVVAHVSDLALLRPAHKMARSHRTTDSYRAPGVFSTHRIASLRIFDEVLEPMLESSRDTADTIVITGFDHFSQTLLELLLSRGEGEIDKLIVVDEAASKHIFMIQEDIDLSGVNLECVDGSCENPATWDTVFEQLAENNSTIVVLANTDPEKNFRASMLLHNRREQTKVYLRCFRDSTFYTVLAAQLDTELLCLENVLQSALEDHYEALMATA
ncbi:MAG: NAD-binding protein [Haliea sp.]|jgi:voltage-gated potassium channel Kch|nr:NAD-binding protein [Haliea sp.]